MSPEEKKDDRSKKKKKKEKNILKSVLIDESLTQAEVAKLAGLSEKTVNKACKHVKISGKSKRKIIKALNVLSDSNVYTVKMVFPKPGKKEV